MTTLVGGVSQLYQGDLDAGRVAVERLVAEDLGRDVVVEDLHYGAVAVAQRLEDARPETLVLVGAAQRGRAPGTVERKRVVEVPRAAAAVHRAVADAVTGYVTVDLVLEVAGGLGALPPRTVTVELEPAALEPSDRLSSVAVEALPRALELVRAEVRRAPLLVLAERIRALAHPARLEPSPALDALDDVLSELRLLDVAGRWGATFALRDRLRRSIAEGATGYGMDHLDWGLWWALLEELDRLQPLELASPSPDT